MDLLAQLPPDLLINLLTGGGLGVLAQLLPRGIRQAVLGPGLALAGAADQKKAEDKATAETEGRYAASMGDINRLQEQYVPGLEELGADLSAEQQRGQQGQLRAFDRQLETVGGLLGRGAGQDAETISGLQRDVTGGLQDRYSRNIANLQGLGAQAESDINRAFDNSRQLQSDLLSERGLGASTILAPTLSNVERERTDALGGLNEQLRREQIGLDVDLSGDVFGSMRDLGGLGLDVARGNRGAMADFQSGFANNRSNLLGGQSDARIGMMRDIGLAPMNLDIDLTTQRNNLRGNRQDVPPSQTAFNQFASGLGARGAPSPEAPGVLEQAGSQALGTGGGMAIGFSAKFAFGLPCIDGEAVLETPTGTTTLREVNIGQKVRGVDGDFYEVTAKLFDDPHKEQENDFIEWITQDGYSLVATRDHLIVSSGPIKDVRPALPVPCGDIMLKGCGAYMANGFDVASMIGLSWAKLTEEQRRSMTCRS